MTATSKPLAEITTQAIRVLCREIGAVNTARFLNQFTTGFGNYTAERDHILGSPTVDELIAEIRKKKDKASSLKSRGKSARSTKRSS